MDAKVANEKAKKDAKAKLHSELSDQAGKDDDTGGDKGPDNDSTGKGAKE